MNMWRQYWLKLTAPFLTAWLLMTTAACGEVVETYTNKAEFLAALAGTNDTVDFEAETAGVDIPDGSTIDGVTFNDSGTNHAMMATDVFSQRSTNGAMCLGLNSEDSSFLSGDIVSMSLDHPTLAIGLYVIGSPGDVRTNDFTLSAAGTVAPNSGNSDAVLPDDGEAFFLGIIITEPDIDSAFTNATLTSMDVGGEGLFVFNIDDVTISTESQSGSASADIVVSRTGPSTAELGDKITFSTTIEDLGPTHAWEVTVAHSAPPELTFLYNQGDIIQDFPFEFTIIPTNDSLSVDTTYLVPSDYAGPVVVTSTISVTASTPDPNPGQEVVSWTTIIDPSGDRDRDCVNNSDEVTANTDPESADSFLAILDTDVLGSQAWIEWQGGIWATQIVERSYDLMAVTNRWVSIYTNMPPTAVLTNILDWGATNRRVYYRIRISE